MESTKHQEENQSLDEDIEITILCLGKRCGLNFDEINQLRIKDLIKFTKIYNGKEERKPKLAAQEDIDKFYI